MGRAGPASRSGTLVQQVSHPDLQRPGDLFGGLDGGVLGRPLNLADEGPVQPRTIGQLFL